MTVECEELVASLETPLWAAPRDKNAVTSEQACRCEAPLNLVMTGLLNERSNGREVSFRTVRLAIWSFASREGFVIGLTAAKRGFACSSVAQR